MPQPKPDRRGQMLPRVSPQALEALSFVVWCCSMFVYLAVSIGLDLVSAAAGKWREWWAT